MGDGDDKVEYNGTASPPIATGSYFDGGGDTLVVTEIIMDCYRL